MDHIFNYVDTILQKKDGCLEEKLYLCRRITIISGCEGWYNPSIVAYNYAFALFVPTSSAALGIAFKASLMLCSHLHEQSGRGILNIIIEI